MTNCRIVVENVVSIVLVLSFYLRMGAFVGSVCCDSVCDSVCCESEMSENENF